MKILSRQRPLPSIEIRVPTRFNRSVWTDDVNWQPLSVFSKRCPAYTLAR